MYKIKTEEGETQLPDAELYTLILNQALKELDSNENLNQLDQLTKHIYNSFGELYFNCSVEQMSKIHLATGYYLRIFFEKNKVIHEEEKDGN